MSARVTTRAGRGGANTTEHGLPRQPNRMFGWLPDKPDQRDLRFNHLRVLRRLRGRLPSRVDLRELGLFDPVLDQGNLGSCTANAIAKAYAFAQRKQGQEAYTPSRLFIYYGEREIEGAIPWDSGAYIRDGLKVVNTLGAPHEALWPYNIGRFADRPAASAYADGLDHQAIRYERVDVKTTALKAALAAGFPVVVGFSVYTSFFDIGADGFMPVPKATERVEGGHAVLCVGYRRMRAPWDRYYYDYGIYLNSWAEVWGDRGYFYARLGWMCDLDNADDFWTITEAEAPALAAPASSSRRRAA
jgi:C1A family cysteine protease